MDETNGGKLRGDRQDETSQFYLPKKFGEDAVEDLEEKFQLSKRPKSFRQEVKGVPKVPISTTKII